MTKTLTTIAIVFLTILSLSAYTQTVDTLSLKPLIITSSVLDYIPINNLNTGNFNIGMEFYLKNRKSFYINIGLIKSYGKSGGLFNVSSKSTIGFKTEVEVRHYFNKHKIFEPAILLFQPHIFQYESQTLQNTGYYFAINSFYQWTATERQGINIYTVNRNVNGITIIFGYQCIKKYGLVVDYCVGLGGQYIYSNVSDKLAINNDKDFPWNKYFDKGAGLYPNLIYQVRLGWGL
ncbi:MAG: hypothetical protein A3G23_01165 [Bacteroidetes bacterium RIFCSPLOWO2_12_FULL_37_12]|nr:MAG: hypothetical protein A3G23_01165 [Bacteroidetes bacterium RIFCSPLOWO2_12_FULL_37_12]